jgi:rare lipoprotein A
MRASAPTRGPGLWLVAVLATGCATGGVRPPSQSPPSLLGAQWTGTASWYGDPHHGRETASGEIFDKSKLTAAHRTLPFGARVAVTNLDNGRTVEVRVNDRGPFVPGRLIDLSEGAARSLGGIGVGLMRVRIRVVALPDGVTDTAAKKSPPH